MSDLYEEYGLEMEPEAPGIDPDFQPQSTPPLPPVKKGGVAGKIIALTLGFVLGAGSVVGGVAGAGYWIVSQPVQDTFDTVNNITGANIDFSQYLSPEYSKLKVMELVGELGNVASKFASGQGCLNDLAAISPYVGTALDPLLNTVEGFGLSLNKEDLMATPVSQLPTYILEAAKDMKLVDVLSSVGANVDDPLFKALCYTDENEPVTIRTLMEDPSSLLNNIPLATLLIGEKVIDPATDGLLLSIAYGNSNRYVIDTEQNKVIMNAMRFTKEGDKFYDIDGNEVAVTLEDGVYTVTVKGEKLYLSPSPSDENVYLAYKDTACTQPVHYRKVMLGDLLNGGIEDVFFPIELGSLLNISPLDENPDPITLALAYGEEGTHYKIVDGKIVWLKDAEGNYYKPRTVADLLSGDFTALISDIKLGTLFKISPLDENPDAITLALAYGEEGTHYIIVGEGENREIQWLTDEEGNEYKPRTVGTLLEGDLTGLISDIKLGTLFNISPLDEDPDPLTLALAYGEEGTHYEIVDGEIVWLQDAEGNYYKPRTVGTLLEGNMTDIIYDLKLGTLLKIDPLQKYDADPTNDPQNIMLSLAYGEEGEHYEVVFNEESGKYEIKWLLKEGETDVYYQARTIGDLVNNADSIFNDIRLGTVLDITPLQNHDEDPDNDANELMLALAYGYEGTHYKVVDGKLVWLEDEEGNKYKPRTVRSLTEGDAFGDLRLATALNVDIFQTPGVDCDAMAHALAFGYQGTHYLITTDEGGNKQVKWLPKTIDSETGEVLEYYSYRTVSDMSEMGTMLDDLRLATVLNADIHAKPGDEGYDAMTHALAFGYEGTDFKFVGDDVFNMDGTPYTGYRTVSDMSNMGDMLNDFRLATVLNVKIDDPSADAMTHALAFGYEGTDFKFVGDEVCNMDGTPYNGYRTVADMSDMGNIIDELRLSTVLGVKIDETPTAANAMTHAIAFGYEGVDFEFGADGTVYNYGTTNVYDGYRTVADMSNMNNIINSLRIETALSIKPDPNGTRLLQVLAYGSNLEYKKDADGNYVKDENGNYIVLNPDYNTIADLSSTTNNIIDRLTINDMLGAENIKDDMLLSHLGNATLTTLPDEVSKLTFKRVYPKQIYKNDYVVYEGGERKILLYTTSGGETYYKYSDSGLRYTGDESLIIREYYYNSLVPEGGSAIEETGHIAENDLFYNESTNFYNYKDAEGNTYEVHLILTGQWKYLLVDPEDPEGYAHDYPLTDFGSLITNMTKNMTQAKLYDLSADGIITLSDTTLDTKIVTEVNFMGNGFTFNPEATPSNADGKLRLGDLTVTQIMDYTALLITFISGLGLS